MISWGWTIIISLAWMLLVYLSFVFFIFQNDKKNYGLGMVVYCFLVMIIPAIIFGFGVDADDLSILLKDKPHR